MTKCFFYGCRNDAVEPYVWCKEHIEKHDKINNRRVMEELVNACIWAEDYLDYPDVGYSIEEVKLKLRSAIEMGRESITMAREVI